MPAFVGRVESGHVKELTRYRTAEPFSEVAVPTDEHYMPLLYIAGVRRPDDALATVFEGFQNASLSMRCIQVASLRGEIRIRTDARALHRIARTKPLSVLY